MSHPANLAGNKSSLKVGAQTPSTSSPFTGATVQQKGKLCLETQAGQQQKLTMILPVLSTNTLFILPTSENSNVCSTAIGQMELTNH